MALTLHSMWRATAPYRVRIALALKGLDYSYVGHDLVGGEARRAPYTDLNRQGLVPALETGDGVLTQSLAILEWLEETHPEPPLLPKGARERAVVRSMAEIVACDIHPLGNLRVLQALGGLGHPMGGDDQTAWGQRWITAGFDALELMVDRYGAGFAFGDDADDRRLLPDPADLVVEPLPGRPFALPGAERRLRPRRRPPRLPGRPPRTPAGRGPLKSWLGASGARRRRGLSNTKITKLAKLTKGYSPSAETPWCCWLSSCSWC